MCNKCPGDYKTVQENTGSMSSSYMPSGQSSNNPKTITKRVLSPCMCHCDVDIQHIAEQSNREYCPVCRHYLRK